MIDGNSDYLKLHSYLPNKSSDCLKINKKQPNLTILNSWGKIGQYIEGLFEMENQLEPNDLNDLLDEPEEFVPEFIQIADL